MKILNKLNTKFVHFRNILEKHKANDLVRPTNDGLRQVGGGHGSSFGFCWGGPALGAPPVQSDIEGGKNVFCKLITLFLLISFRGHICF